MVHTDCVVMKGVITDSAERQSPLSNELSTSMGVGCFAVICLQESK